VQVTFHFSLFSVPEPLRVKMTALIRMVRVNHRRNPWRRRACPIECRHRLPSRRTRLDLSQICLQYLRIEDWIVQHLHLEYLSSILHKERFSVNDTQKDGAARDQLSASTLFWVNETGSFSHCAAKWPPSSSFSSAWLRKFCRSVTC